MEGSLGVLVAILTSMSCAFFAELQVEAHESIALSHEPVKTSDALEGLGVQAPGRHCKAPW